jgi:outer membrane protein assembly factor BamB
MRPSWQLFNLHFWLKLLAGLTVTAIILTVAQIILAPHQNIALKFDGQIGDFYADQIIADLNTTSTETLSNTPNCILVPAMAGSLSCVTDSGAVRWQTILTDALSSPPIFLTTKKTLLLTQYGGGLLMVSEQTGDIIWQFKDLHEFNWKQTLVSQDQKFVALLNSRNQVFVIEVETGSLQWKAPENTTAPIEQKTKIFIHENKVFMADSAAYTLTSLRFENGTQIWRQENYTGDTAIKAQFAGGLIWYFTNFFTWQGVNPETGEVKAKFTPPPDGVVTNLNTALVFHNYGNQLFWFDAQTGALLKTPALTGKIQSVLFDKQLYVRLAEAPFIENITAIDSTQRTVLWKTNPLQIIKDFLVLDENLAASISLDGRITWLKLKTGEIQAQVKTQETPLVMLRQEKSHQGLWLITTHHGTFSTNKQLTDVWFFETPGKLTLHRRDLPVVGATGLVRENKLWLINLSQNMVVGITQNPLQRDLRYWLRPTKRLPKFFNTLGLAVEKLVTANKSTEKQLNLETIVTKNFQGCLISTTITPKNALFKKITHQSGFNPWIDSKVTATLKRKSEVTTVFPGHYFLPNKWRAFGIAPKLESEELLTLEIKLQANGLTLSEKTQVSVPANCGENFITLSDDKKNLQTPTDRFFWGMGVQDVVLDKNNNGSLFDDWQFGLTEKPDFTTELVSHDFKTYLKTFRDAGFSIFRISQDNFSYKNWLSFQPTAFRASLHTGLITDEFLKQLRAENFRVVFGIFGFQPETESDAVTAYLDYCIARFGPWIDVWEISNEAWPDEKWVSFVSEYLKKHDPYNHPITTNWDRSNLNSIDIVNLHYYRSEPTTELTAEFLNQIFAHRNTNKPILFGEFGNSETNWDLGSAERLRIKSWLSAWQRSSLIIWNQSGSKSTQKENSNLYMGTQEFEVTRKLVSWLKKYDGIPLRPFPITSMTGNFCSGLTNTSSLILVYCTNSSDVPRAELFEPTTVFSAAGITTTDREWKVTWTDPKTLLQKDITKFSTGEMQNIASPAFSPDLVSEWQLQ